MSACGSFGAAGAPAGDVDASTVGALDGGGADGPGPVDAALPDALFCARAPKDGVLFCNDFDGPGAFTDGWSDLSSYNGKLLSAVSFGANRAAGVKGAAANAQFDRLASPALSVPAATTSAELEFKILLTRALTKAEILTIEVPVENDAVNLVLDGDRLFIRLGSTESSGVPLGVGAWTRVVLRVDLTGMTLRTPTGAETLSISTQGLAGQVDAHVAAGLYYKQDPGELDYALDDILFTATAR